MNVALGSQYPDQRTAVDHMAVAESLLVVAPDSPESWYHLGDGYFHYGKVLDIPNSARRAERALVRAVELDSTFVPALTHLPELYVELGDSTALRRALRALPDSGDVEIAERYLAHVVLGDSAAVKALRKRIPKVPRPDNSGFIRFARLGYISMEDAAVADSAFSSRAVSTQDRARAAFGGAALALDRGHPKRAAGLLSQAPDSLLALGLAIAVYLQWDGDSAAAEFAVSKLRAASPALELTEGVPERRSRMAALFFLARFELARGDTSSARKIVQRLRSAQIPSSDPALDAVRREYLLLLETQSALQGRRPELRQRLSSLDSAIHVGRNAEVGGVGPLLSARGWEVLNEPTRALAALRRQFRQVSDSYNSAELREEGRLAELTGDRAGAMRAYRHFLRLRSDPEPSLRTDTEQVRAALRRLEKADAPR